MTPLEESERKKLLSAAFQMPKIQTMVSRKSSITNAFVNAVIPSVQPSFQEIEKALQILKMDVTNMHCAYCGNKMTEWDHLRPIVLNQRPTGYISEIANLVPACAKCNQSKGNKQWRIWIVSETAQHSPTKRLILDVAERIARLELYEQWLQPTVIDFEAILGTEEWTSYWQLWESVNAEMARCQQVANGLRKRIADRLRHSGQSG